jgi:hypothetical protein
MSYTNGLDKPSDYFEAFAYTGDGNTKVNFASDFTPDMTWFKVRNNTYDHQIHDSVRGVSVGYLDSATNVAEQSSYPIASFDSDGVTTVSGNITGVNKTSDLMVSWNWKKTADAGFDIVSYSGNNSTNRQISHSLSAKPDMMLVKCRQAGLWKIYHSSLGATKYLVLSDTAAVVDNNSTWNDTEPTSSNFTLGDDGNVNETGETYINYLFAEKKSFSKIGSYIGTGSDVFIHTGFKVGWLLVKNADNTNGWLVIDTKRSPANPQGKYIYANAGGAEGTVTYGEFFSNGFGWKGTGSVAVNQSGEKFIYYAIAENPFVTSTGVPATAR